MSGPEKNCADGKIFHPIEDIVFSLCCTPVTQVHTKTAHQADETHMSLVDKSQELFHQGVISLCHFRIQKEDARRNPEWFDLGVKIVLRKLFKRIGASRPCHAMSHDWTADDSYPQISRAAHVGGKIGSGRILAAYNQQELICAHAGACAKAGAFIRGSM
jgi:hypothetical protein